MELNVSFHRIIQIELVCNKKRTKQKLANGGAIYRYACHIPVVKKTKKHNWVTVELAFEEDRQKYTRRLVYPDCSKTF